MNLSEAFPVLGTPQEKKGSKMTGRGRDASTEDDRAYGRGSPFHRKGPRQAKDLNLAIVVLRHVM